jgi:hypothetical protein
MESRPARKTGRKPQVSKTETWGTHVPSARSNLGRPPEDVITVVSLLRRANANATLPYFPKRVLPRQAQGEIATAITGAGKPEASGLKGKVLSAVTDQQPLLIGIPVKMYPEGF